MPEPTVVGRVLALYRYPVKSMRGGLLAFGEREGSARVRVMERIPRCAMINIDPHSVERDPAVLKVTGLVHDACAGVLSATEKPGTIETGDTIYLLAKG